LKNLRCDADIFGERQASAVNDITAYYAAVASSAVNIEKIVDSIRL
jgi:hypothetical protein